GGQEGHRRGGRRQGWREGERQRPPAPEALAADGAAKARPQQVLEVGPGVFVTLEGIDRSGKTTQAALLRDALGPEALLLREPGGTEAGERVRDLLKDAELELEARAELLLFCAARAELCSSVIRPALGAGRSVICDRFV